MTHPDRSEMGFGVVKKSARLCCEVEVESEKVQDKVWPAGPTCSKNSEPEEEAGMGLLKRRLSDERDAPNSS
jgi:hypothetical protein